MTRTKLALALAVAAALATSPLHAQSGGVIAGSAPGAAVAAQTVKITATITGIDKSTREITLKGPQGNLATVTASPDVTNFDNLKVGDQVDLQYIEALAIELKKGGGLVVGRSDKAGANAAKPGATPGAAVGREITVVADVVAVDPATQRVTLRGPNRTVDVRIADPEQFKRIAKGDQVEAKYVQALAVAVAPAARK